MSKKIEMTPEQWAEEFQSFMTASVTEPPKNLTTKIIASVHSDLNPSAARVFSKITLTHLIVGTLMLLICPQFGIALFDGMGLMALFMGYGETVCSLACGAVFLGSSTLAASLILRPEELKVIRRNRFLQLSLLTIISIGVFISIGAKVVFTLALAWTIGSLLGGLATLELGWLIRSFFRRRILYNS